MEGAVVVMGARPGVKLNVKRELLRPRMRLIACSVWVMMLLAHSESSSTGQYVIDTRTYYASQLEEDSAAAARELQFAKARAGTLGSSQGLDLDGEFQRRYDRGLLEINNRADSAASGMRSADEQARLGLISKVVAGMDQGSVTSSALAQLQSNAELSQQNAKVGRMANVFADLLSTYNAAQGQAGMDAARRQHEQQNQFGAFIPNNGAYGGTVSR